MAFKWSAPAAITTALSSEFVSLGSSTMSALSAAIDNSSQLNMFADFQIDVTYSSTAAASGGFIGIYCVPAMDGSNYATSAVTYTPNLLTSVPLTTLATQQLITVRNLLLPPMLLKLAIYNGASVGMPTSSTATCSLKYITYNTQ